MLSFKTQSDHLTIASYKLGTIPLILTERQPCVVWLLVRNYFPVTTNTLRDAICY